MNTKRIVSIIFALLFFIFEGRTQHIQSSHYYLNPILLGPSFAGHTPGSRFTANYRDQWPSVSTYKTFSVAFDQHIFQKKSGIGLYALRDISGSGKLGTTEVGLQYSYNIQLTRFSFIRPGLQIKYVQRSLDYMALIFADQLDPSFVEPPSGYSLDISNFISDKVSYVTFASSVAYVSQYIWGGVTVDNITPANQAFLVNSAARIPMKIMAYGGARYYFEPRIHNRKKNNAQINVSFVYRFMQGFNQLDAGAYYRKNGLMTGLWFRGMPLKVNALKNVDAMIFMLGYDFGSLTLAYSYDFTVSGLINKTGGANEITFRYTFDELKLNNLKKRSAMVPCSY